MMLRRLIDSIYYKGFEAGHMACKVEMQDEVEELVVVAFAAGIQEGKEMQKAEVGEIDIDDLPL